MGFPLNKNLDVWLRERERERERNFIDVGKHNALISVS
jgi:hypothetical protein